MGDCRTSAAKVASTKTAKRGRGLLSRTKTTKTGTGVVKPDHCGDLPKRGRGLLSRTTAGISYVRIRYSPIVLPQQPREAFGSVRTRNAMPRAPRLELAGVPLHVTQRGVNRCAIFVDDADRHHYRHLLREACRTRGVQVHAFVLMDNHVHLLLAAPECGAISAAMHSAGQCYVQAFNTRHHRCGTLFQGRFKSCLVESDRYLLNVMRYIELNPVRAAMVATAHAWRWSSVHSHAGNACDSLVTPNPAYLALGDTRECRVASYREWLRAGISDDELASIRKSLAQERSLGDERFQRMIERCLNRPAACRPPGRPRNASPLHSD